MTLRKDRYHKGISVAQLSDGSLFMFTRQSAAGAQP